jgi:hypothetical protein
MPAGVVGDSNLHFFWVNTTSNKYKRKRPAPQLMDVMYRLGAACEMLLLTIVDVCDVESVSIGAGLLEASGVQAPYKDANKQQLQQSPYVWASHREQAKRTSAAVTEEKLLDSGNALSTLVADARVSRVSTACLRFARSISRATEVVMQ